MNRLLSKRKRGLPPLIPRVFLLIWIGLVQTGCLLYDPVTWESTFKLVHAEQSSNSSHSGIKVYRDPYYPDNWDPQLPFKPAGALKDAEGDLVLKYPYQEISSGVSARHKSYGYRELKIKQRDLQPLDQYRHIKAQSFPRIAKDESEIGAPPEIIASGQPVPVRVMNWFDTEKEVTDEEQVVIVLDRVAFWYVPVSVDHPFARIAGVELPETELAWYGYPLRAIEIPIFQTVLIIVAIPFIISYYAGGDVP